MVEKLDTDTWEDDAECYQIIKNGEYHNLKGFGSNKYSCWREAIYEELLEKYTLVMTDKDGVKRIIDMEPAIDDELMPWRFRKIEFLGRYHLYKYRMVKKDGNLVKKIIDMGEHESVDTAKFSAFTRICEEEKFSFGECWAKGHIPEPLYTYVLQRYENKWEIIKIFDKGHDIRK